MSLAPALSVLVRWVLALLFGLGPLGAEILAALGHAQVCTCCSANVEDAGCCATNGKASDVSRVAELEDACACALVVPSRATPWTGAPRASDVGSGARARLERFHRMVELAWAELPLPVATETSSPAPPGNEARSGPAGSGSRRAAERVAALGVLRL